MAHFQKLNDLIQTWRERENEMSPSEVEFYLKKESITDIALEASARLFYPAAEACEIAEAVKVFIDFTAVWAALQTLLPNTYSTAPVLSCSRR